MLRKPHLKNLRKTTIKKMIHDGLSSSATDITIHIISTLQHTGCLFFLLPLECVPWYKNDDRLDAYTRIAFLGCRWDLCVSRHQSSRFHKCISRQKLPLRLSHLYEKCDSRLKHPLRPSCLFSKSVYQRLVKIDEKKHLDYHFWGNLYF